MFGERIHRYIFLFGLISLGFGVMMGAVPTSVPQMILLGNWLVEGGFKRKWRLLKINKVFWVLAAVYFIHLLGLLYTEQLPEGLKDIKTKVPLLLLPLILFTTQPLSLKEFHAVLYCFIAGSITDTAWCIYYSFVLHANEGLRAVSRFMSHIRLGLYLNMAIATCIYFVAEFPSAAKKIIWALLAAYFVFVLYLLGLASGLANFAILFLIGLCVIIYRQKPILKIVGSLVLITFLALIANYIYGIKEYQLHERATENNIPQKFTPSGRLYIHLEKKGQKENGNYVQLNLQPEELYQEWKRYSPADSFNLAARHNLERYNILVRYMSSKGLRKDSADFAKLTEADKKNIYNSISNYEYPDWSYLHKRTYELVNEYDEFINHRFVNGHSLTMRAYFWKAALHLIEQRPLTGVGTGDVQQELNKAYVETKSPLEEEWYKRPHNQFLTIMAALGLTGLVVFLWSLVYPVMRLKRELPLLYWPFFIVAFLSFFLEDTLETQAGCTFYAFFNTLFISMALHKKSTELERSHS